MVDQIAEILGEYNYKTLQAMAGFYGLKTPGLKKNEVIQNLGPILTNPKRILEAYQRLNPAARETVHILLRQEGEARVFTLRQRLVDKKMIEQGDESREFYREAQPIHNRPDSRRFPELMAYLQACGLVFTHAAKNQYSQIEPASFNLASEYYIPEYIRRILPTPPPEPEWTPEIISQPELTREGSARTFQRDLYLYWSYVNQNKVDLTQKNQLAKRHLVAINNTLLLKENILVGQVESDFHRLVFIRAVLENLQLLESRGGYLRAQESNQFFSLSPQDRVKRSLDAYLTSTAINELSWFCKLHTSSVSAPFHPAPKVLLDSRRRILKHLRPVRGWVKTLQLINHIRSVDYEFLFPRDQVFYRVSYYGPTHPYTASTNTLGWDFLDVKSEVDGWNRVEAGLIKTIFHGPMFWMGLVDLGLEKAADEDATEIHLTPLGSWLLANGKEPEIPQGGGQVIIQPDFTITAFDPVSDAVLYDLDQFAERVAAERAIQLRLTQKSVYAGQLRGWDAARIQAHLENLTGQPLPGNIARTLQEWQVWHERIRVLPRVTILHASSEEDLTMLDQDADLAPWLMDRPAESLAVIPKDRKPEELYHLLLKHQHLPLISRTAGALPDRAVQIDPSGRLSFRVKTPDLYLRGYLSRFTDQDSQDGYCLTPASVRRAAASGMTAPQIISELEKVLSLPLPGELQKNILAWAGHYGQANLEEVTLLSFKDDKTVRELLKDPELATYLHPFKAQDIKVTVQVHNKDLERVTRLLTERGVILKRRN